jgi:hypothetical protein
MSDPIRVGGGYWTCEKCGEEYHASNIHECAEPSRVPSEEPTPRQDLDDPNFPSDEELDRLWEAWSDPNFTNVAAPVVAHLIAALRREREAARQGLADSEFVRSLDSMSDNAVIAAVRSRADNA